MIDRRSWEEAVALVDKIVAEYRAAPGAEHRERAIAAIKKLGFGAGDAERWLDKKPRK